MMKYEWRKQEKNLYGVKQTPVIVEVPKQKFILVKGKGNPNEVDFSDRISALYSLAYAIKMLFKNAMKKKQAEELSLLDCFSRVRTGIYMPCVCLEMILDISNCPG